MDKSRDEFLKKMKCPMNIASFRGKQDITYELIDIIELRLTGLQFGFTGKF